MKIGLAGILLALGGIVALFWALDLLPSRRLSMAAGAPGSAYHAIAEQYRDILAEDGIVLDIVETPGSLANAAALAEGRADVAILQGGILPDPGGREVMALAAIFVEPMFVIQRASFGAEAEPVAWAGLRVAAGAKGSGTRAAVEAVLDALGNPAEGAELLPLSGQDAAAALMDGTVDVALFVAPVTAPYLSELLADPALRVAEIRDAEALERLMPFIELAAIPASGFDYRRHLPPEPLELPATVAALAARADLHPALVDRLVRAAQRIHRAPDLVTPEGRFPSARNLMLPMNRQAEALLGSPPSALDRFLPFWAVAQVNRVAVLLVPIFLLLLPLLRALPGLYRWSMHKRVYRHYDAVLAVDGAIDDADTDALTALDRKLDHIAAEARQENVPVRYREYVYNLLLHLNHVRNRLRTRQAALAEAEAEGG